MAKKYSRSKNRKEGDLEINRTLSEIDIDNVNTEKEKAQAAISRIKFETGFKLKTEKQKELIRKIHENEIIFVAGPAGTGKTIIALKGALESLVHAPEKYNKILITKPVVEAGGESIGFLPGDIMEKISPYMFSFESNFKKLVGNGVTKLLFDTDVVKTVPLPYMRGNTFSGCICILDEAQNTTISGMKLFISRKGTNSKLIILGDTEQTDLHLKHEKTGLKDAFERFQGIAKVEFVEFGEEDIVRDPLLIEIMKRYRVDK